jgi:hypothetical protein
MRVQPLPGLPPDVTPCTDLWEMHHPDDTSTYARLWHDQHGGQVVITHWGIHRGTDSWVALGSQDARHLALAILNAIPDEAQP